jgi:hypothetical protein
MEDGKFNGLQIKMKSERAENSRWSRTIKSATSEYYSAYKQKKRKKNETVEN